MPESPSSSFIPKRSPGQKQTTKRTGNYVVLSMVSYALFVSAPLASAGVFIYERHTENQFNKAVVALDEAIFSFKEEDLVRVAAFDDRLTQSKKILNSHVSVVSLLSTLEAATARTVTFKNLDITRTSPGTLSVAGLLSTPALDGALFQRSSYAIGDIIQSPLFSDVKIIPAGEATAESGTSEKSVEFKATFNFAVADILYRPVSITAEETTTRGSDPALAGESESSEVIIGGVATSTRTDITP